jgi:hypothetical protein
MLADNVALEQLLPQHDQLANTERICGKWVHMGERAASDKKGYNSDNNNENNNNKWCDACGSVQTCLGMRAHCNAAEWHGSHGYSGVSVAHDMCMRMRSCACLCGIVCTCLCCHGLRCGSSSRRPGHSRPDSPPFQRLSLPWPAQNKLEGIVTFENCPHGLRNWKREGLGACARLGCAPTQRRLHLPAQMR